IDRRIPNVVFRKKNFAKGEARRTSGDFPWGASAAAALLIAARAPCRLAAENPHPRAVGEPLPSFGNDTFAGAQPGQHHLPVAGLLTKDDLPFARVAVSPDDEYEAVAFAVAQRIERDNDCVRLIRACDPGRHKLPILQPRLAGGRANDRLKGPRFRIERRAYRVDPPSHLVFADRQRRSPLPSDRLAAGVFGPRGRLPRTDHDFGTDPDLPLIVGW